MKAIINGIKILLAVVCLIAAVALLVVMGFSFNKTDLLDVELICQYPSYPTGCESTSLTMLLRYYGVDVSVDDVIACIPQGSKPYLSDGIYYGANPEHAFVGSPYDDSSYGVYNEPIAEAANQFKEGAITKTGASVSQISKILKTGNPVVAWFTSHPDKDFSYDMGWYAEDDGTYIEWPSGEHAVVVCGEDLLNYYYADPYTGTTKKVNKLTFRKYFNKLGGRIVYYQE